MQSVTTKFAVNQPAATGTSGSRSSGPTASSCAIAARNVLHGVALALGAGRLVAFADADQVGVAAVVVAMAGCVQLVRDIPRWTGFLTAVLACLAAATSIASSIRGAPTLSIDALEKTAGSPSVEKGVST